MSPESDVPASWLQRAQWQPIVFAPEPRRLDLLKLKAAWACAPFRLRVHRNHAFEFVASVLDPFLAFGARRAEVAYSDYDDSLGFRVEGTADVELLWVDFSRYRDRLDADALARWLSERVNDLRSRTDATVLIADDPGAGPAPAELNGALSALARTVPGVRVAPLSQIGAALGPLTFDERAARITGTALSDAACVRAAQLLGLVSLPAVLAPRIKAVVLDLDNTLYSGVLGEDGPAGLRLLAAHVEMQEKLVQLQRRGVFLAVASRNEAVDVDRLFSERPDFPLRPEHLSARAIAFREKASGLREIAAALRIAPDAMLFVDDNPGEIATVAGELPGIKVLHGADPELTARALDLYPGLHGHAEGRDDALRVADLKAAEVRAEAARAAQSPEEYLRSLEIVLTFATNSAAHLARAAELSNKTNQFNTALLRLTEAQVAKRLGDPSCCTVVVSLRDRLSDSGIVGVVFARREGATLVVDEIDISCRALGRNIEPVMITEALRCAMRTLPSTEVRFSFRGGPRNDPARRFLAEYAGLAPDADHATMAWHEARAAGLVGSLPVSIVHEVTA